MRTHMTNDARARLASDAYIAARRRVIEQLARIAAGLDLSDAEQATTHGSWAHAGSMGEAADQLAAVADFLLGEAK